VTNAEAIFCLNKAFVFQARQYNCGADLFVSDRRHRCKGSDAGRQKILANEQSALKGLKPTRQSEYE
jgi:hypothetical protein